MTKPSPKKTATKKLRKCDDTFINGWMEGTALAISQLNKMGFNDASIAFANWLHSEMGRLNPGIGKW